MNKKYILAVDQGTTSSRAILLDEKMKIVALSQKKLTAYFPHSGWVEHNSEEIWDSILSVCREVIKKQQLQIKNIIALGITNQRETTLVWDKETGKTIYNAIVWQDRRTSQYCQKLKEQGLDKKISQITGLVCDPYFSATKLHWILETIEGAKTKAKQGKLLFGTVDSYLLWCFTNGKVHKTDISNASRTMLFDIYQQKWSQEILDLMEIPYQMLPEVCDNCHNFGQVQSEIFGAPIKITSMIGDQQSATIGQACFQSGMLKSTYGTGCFALLNTGIKPIKSNNKLLTTIAYRVDGQTHYALEGSIFIAGAVVQWLRDNIKIIQLANQSGEFAQKANHDSEVYFVPAFVGLGAPYWDADCRGAIYGLTRNTTQYDITKAALESIAFQTKDLLHAMQDDWENFSDIQLRVDGGMVNSEWTLQCLADILQMTIDVPEILETTALGVAYLAGKECDFYPDFEAFSQNWLLKQKYSPQMEPQIQQQKYLKWLDAVQRTLKNYS